MISTLGVAYCRFHLVCPGIKFGERKEGHGDHAVFWQSQNLYLFSKPTKESPALRNPVVFCVDTCTRDPLGWPSSSSERVALGRLFLQLLPLVSNKHLISLSERVAGASSHELLRGVDPQVAERLGAGHGIHCHLFGA